MAVKVFKDWVTSRNLDMNVVEKCEEKGDNDNEYDSLFSEEDLALFEKRDFDL